MVQTSGDEERLAAGAAAEWDAFVASHPAGHLLQTASWGALKARFGWRVRRVAQADGAGHTVAGAQLLYRRVAGLKMAYLPRGPVTNWQDQDGTAALFDRVAHQARTDGAVVLKVEPDLPDTAVHRGQLRALGFTPSLQSVQPPSTIVLDLSGDGETIQAAMKSKWRYNIRLAERKGVTVRTMTRADLPAFAELMTATGARDGFAVHSIDYYAAAHELFNRDQVAFLLADYQGVALASIVVFAVGQTAWYLWGASSDRERNRMPNHALQWAGIQWARGRGARRYDLWGIPDAIGRVAVAMEPDGCGVAVDRMPIDVQQLPPDELWGVYRFKQGFGGAVIRTVGAWDRPLDTLGYRLYTTGVELSALKTTAGRLVNRSPAEWLGFGHQRLPGDVRRITEPAAWRDLLAGLPDPHLLQSWEWGEVKSRAEWEATRFALIGAGGRPVAAFQLLTRLAQPGLPIRIGYVAKGPVLDWNDGVLAEQVLQRIEQTAAGLGCIFVKIDPDVAPENAEGRRLLHTLFRRGWRLSDEQIQFKNTAFSDLAGGEESVFAGFKSKWRYNVRLAERRGIQVRAGGADDLAAFYALYAETGARDGFLIRPFGYYRDVWSTFLAAQGEPDNPAGGALLLAEHPEETEPLAGLFLLRYGACAWYFYGASSERRRRDMPNHLLQWEAMRWAMAQGCTRYDWWGAPTRIDLEGDAMQGVWQFKQGFGAEFQPHIGAWDFPISKPLYAAFAAALPQARALIRRWR